MSRIGDIDKMYGKNFSVVTTNASGADILNDSESSFISSALIIASPIDANGNDLGFPSMLATDADGKPIRLTYAVQPGNGLVLAYTTGSADVLSFAIDNDTLKTSEVDGAGYLFVSASGLTEYSQYMEVDELNNIDVALNELHDSYRLVVTHVPKNEEPDSPLIARLTVDASKLIDKHTLITNQNDKEAASTYYFDQRISVNVPNLADGKTIIATESDGKSVLAVSAQDLAKASSTSYGVVKIDNKTLKTSKNGSVYVDISSFDVLGPRGGTGIVRYASDGKGDLKIDNNGFLRTNPKEMPKAQVVNSGSNNGFGVCAADGVTINASTNGVLSVITDGLSVASLKKAGLVRPDGKTITIERSGIISVNAKNLPAASASNEGIVKYDNSTIVKNTQGQLSVANASSWNTAIADLNTRISTFTEQLASLRSDLTNVLAKLGQTVSAAFNVFTVNGKPLQSLRLLVPNTYKNGAHVWDTANCSGWFKIQYAAGYIFSCRLTGGTASSWMQNCKIIVNGQPYGMNQDIKLSGNEALCSLQMTIQGYGNLKVQRPQGSWSLEFKDNSGNPLKSISLYVNSLLAKSNLDEFVAEFNGKDITQITNTPSVVDTSSITDLVKKDPTLIGGVKTLDGKLVIKDANGTTSLIKK